MSKKAITVANTPAAIGPYSKGYVAGGFVFTSGAGGRDPRTGRIVSEEIESQAEQACINIGEVLVAGGAGYEDVIKVNVYLADMSYFDAFNEVYAKYFTSKPARTCVAVKELPLGLLCELEAIAYIGE